MYFYFFKHPSLGQLGVTILSFPKVECCSYIQSDGDVSHLVMKFPARSLANQLIMRF